MAGGLQTCPEVLGKAMLHKVHLHRGMSPGHGQGSVVDVSPRAVNACSICPAVAWCGTEHHGQALWAAHALAAKPNWKSFCSSSLFPNASWIWF